MKPVMQHELEGKVYVVGVTDFDATEDLGAPFKVVLSNGVKQEMCDGNVVATTIADLTGLYKAVVQTRVQNLRKLNGAELKFIRRVVGLQAKTVAQKIDITPEHLSRCEAGAKTLSGSSEKIFRALVFVSSFYPDPQSIIADKKKALSTEMVEKMNKLLIHFIDMNIKTVYSINDPLALKFCLDWEDNDDDEDDDTAWESCGAEAA